MSAHSIHDDTKPETLGAVDTRNLLELLFERASPSMSDVELAHVAKGGFYAQTLAGQAATLANSLAGLACNDSCLDGASKAGSLEQGEDVAKVLWHLSELFSQIDGVLSVAGGAASLLAWRRNEAKELAIQSKPSTKGRDLPAGPEAGASTLAPG